MNLTTNELNEVCAKLANELEIYKKQATDELKTGFIKLMDMLLLKEEKEVFMTTLMKKHYKRVRASFSY